MRGASLVASLVRFRIRAKASQVHELLNVPWSSELLLQPWPRLSVRMSTRHMSPGFRNRRGERGVEALISDYEVMVDLAHWHGKDAVRVVLGI
ncbi:hypothetical protein EI94DRAFT_1726906, partial [Lactarius quietus]